MRARILLRGGAHREIWQLILCQSDQNDFSEPVGEKKLKRAEIW